MIHLYDSEGQHIATLDSSQLYGVSGRHVGAYIDDAGVFVDLRGRYLGEIYQNDRLLNHHTSPFHNRSFPAPPERATIAKVSGTAQPRITMPGGYADVDQRKLGDATDSRYSTPA